MGKNDAGLLSLGKKAPDFNLESSDGDRLTLKSLRGKYAVVVFYPKNNTGG